MKKSIGGYRLIFGYLGIFIAVVGLIMLLPLALLVVPSFQDDIKYAWNFFIPGMSCLFGGLIIFLILAVGRENKPLGKHQDSVLLVFIWLFAIGLSSLPFILSGEMTVSESIFESTSGYATVGLTRFPEHMFNSHIYVFYRAILQFFGGIGFVLVVTSVISDRYGLRLYTAEGHTDRLIPNLSKSARIILSIYIIYIALGTLALWIAGVPVFDALCHSISSVATGGFSSKVGGMLEIGGNPVAVEVITMVLMFLGGTNFVLNMFIITGRFKRVGRDIEIRTFLVFAIILLPLFIVSFLTSKKPDSDLYYSVPEAFRYGVFSFMTGMTTTGYSNMPHGWALAPYGAVFLIIITNVIGAGMGSTAGGVKLYRVGVAAKSYYWTMRAKLSNKRYLYPTYIYRFGERREINKNESGECLGYLVLYMIIMFVGAFAVSVLGNEDLSRSLFEFSNALSSTGLSNGLTMAATNPAVLWILIVGMFAGRLEILAIYYAFFRISRDILRKETY